jgi:hypothetical protein
MKTSARKTKSIHNVLGALVLAVVLASVATPQAQAGEFGVSLDIPLQFAFTGDFKGTATPSGFKAALDLPFYVGVGVESYSVETDVPASTQKLNIDYEFTDFYIWYDFDVMTVSIGGGTGSAQVTEFTGAGGSLVSTDEADADQIFVVLGWLLSESWDFHVAYHQIDAIANNLVSGVADGTTTDLGGVMTTAGFKFKF